MAERVTRVIHVGSVRGSQHCSPSWYSTWALDIYFSAFSFLFLCLNNDNFHELR